MAKLPVKKGSKKAPRVDLPQSPASDGTASATVSAAAGGASRTGRKRLEIDPATNELRAVDVGSLSLAEVVLLLVAVAVVILLVHTF